MDEHLFKLKRDDICVGYCKWTEHFGWHYSLTADFKNTFTHFVVSQTIPISIHPFVTKDKNGKDVFARDSVRSGKRILTIVWGESNLRWMAKKEDTKFQTPLCQWAISEQFELIEDKKDA